MTDLSSSLSFRVEPAAILKDVRALLSWRHRRAINAVTRLWRWLKA